MNAQIRLNENSHLVLTGSVTVRLAVEFARVARDLLTQNRDVTVDCANAEYLDGSILQQLAILAASLRGKGKRLRTVGCSATLTRDSQLVGLSGILAKGNGE